MGEHAWSLVTTNHIATNAFAPPSQEATTARNAFFPKPAKSRQPNVGIPQQEFTAWWMVMELVTRPSATLAQNEASPGHSSTPSRSKTTICLNTSLSLMTIFPSIWACPIGALIAYQSPGCCGLGTTPNTGESRVISLPA